MLRRYSIRYRNPFQSALVNTEPVLTQAVATVGALTIEAIGVTAILVPGPIGPGPGWELDRDFTDRHRVGP